MVAHDFEHLKTPEYVQTGAFEALYVIPGKEGDLWL